MVKVACVDVKVSFKKRTLTLALAPTPLFLFVNIASIEDMLAVSACEGGRSKQRRHLCRIPWMKEKRDNTSREGGLPTLPGLYLSTFQPSQRGFFRVHTFVWREREPEPEFLNYILRTPGINPAELVSNKFASLIALPPTIVDSILGSYSIPGIDFPPLTSLLKLSLCAGNFKQYLGAKNRVGIGLSYPARQATYAGGSDSLESIFVLLKSYYIVNLIRCEDLVRGEVRC